ncbi:MAG: Lrp/AsnC family transcriptional regulator [Saprospiraceae bacterium]|jgi:Lrp/AsnC family transcriptional regulator for asnA, asnC and gidA|nr:Lrp/AsnC family transcriptional regulator [Saprospiraceae bacterium]MBK6667622.1 Lrp/AsnC family transcriptional regulator [Saprospiraceae bacterium]MBK8827286.1 Lrp/AsnC family transcriptional regulator [Saprospiraceae bacterium]MBK9581083.1 Lrp/AsnC family transcriptional regulator [Saprospiraceae bacterium]MBP6540847.1 Lrp/AsnC family transcriptional regulator [Saprospiraceae bacterium]
MNHELPLPQLDIYDTKILQHLEDDGRMAFSLIAQEIGISNTMVHQRVAKMTEQGILKGIKPILDEKKIGYDWASFTGLTLEKDHNSSRIIEALKAIPEVTECYYITGAFTLFIRIVAKNHEHMRRILYDQIDIIPGIAKTDSFMELGCAFRRNAGL